jgi:large subunit ribosomal protein L9
VDDVKELGNYKAKIDFGKGQEIDVDFEVIAE